MLILAQVVIIKLYCAKKGGVKWFFVDARIMVGGTTNKLQVKAANTANGKGGAFSEGRHGVVGKDNSRTDIVLKREQNRFNS